jgi:hypothetical protein
LESRELRRAASATDDASYGDSGHAESAADASGSSVFAAATPDAGPAVSSRRVPHVDPSACKGRIVGKTGPFADPSIIVEFRAHIPNVFEAERCLEDVAPGFWARLHHRFPGITLRPLFGDEFAERFEQSTFLMDRPRSVDVRALYEALRREPIIEHAEMTRRAVLLTAPLWDPHSP